MSVTEPAADGKKGGFWDSTLGVITKITALLSAITGLIVAINQFTSAKPREANQPSVSKEMDVPANTSPSSPERSSPAGVTQIDGHWKDVNTGNDFRVNQDGNTFRFQSSGVVPQGIQFTSTGSGTINGQTVTSSYTATYQNGWTSKGNCSGTVSSDGMRMDLNCTDNLLGNYPSSMVRQ